jgi:hypothetical protein
MTDYRKCNPLYGYRWISEGIKLFLRQPWGWLALVGMTLLIQFILLTLPLLGLLIVFTLFPGIAAGFMRIARELAAGQPARFGLIIAPLREKSAPLLVVGGFAFVTAFAALIILTLGWREEFAQLVTLAQSRSPDTEAIEKAIGELTLPTLTMFALMLPVMMATWFAPALIAFRPISGKQALVASFKAALGNFWPFTVYSVLLIGLDVIVSFAVGLLLRLLNATGGDSVASFVAMLLSFPVFCAFVSILLASAYVSYGDVFEAESKAVNAAGTE